MLAYISENISSFFIDRGIIPEDDREIYVYSFEILLATIINFVVLILLAMISRTIPETFMYILGFVPLRQVTGGYHAKNHFSCFLTLLLSYAMFLTLLHFLPANLILQITFGSVLLSIIAVFIFAPSEDSNKPLSLEDTLLFKKKSRFLYCWVCCDYRPISCSCNR